MLGAVQLGRVKGTTQHRALGYTWVGLMLVIAISSFWIHGESLRLWGTWSPIHLLSILALLMLPAAIYFARVHRVRGHKLTMLGLFSGALLIAGIFTLVPGRIMHRVVFGG